MSNIFLEAAPDFNQREGGALIDKQDQGLQWSDSETESDFSEIEAENHLEVNDEDWEISEKGVSAGKFYVLSLMFL
jgi:hypothetical protein